MNTKSLLYALALSLFGSFNLTYAEPNPADDFPPLQLSTGKKNLDDMFNSNGQTKDLYQKYYSWARMVKSNGDIEAFKKKINNMLKEDLAYWQAQEDMKDPEPPKAPKVAKSSKGSKKGGSNQAMQNYKERLENFREIQARQKATRQAYIKWLSQDVPAWVDNLK